MSDVDWRAASDALHERVGALISAAREGGGESTTAARDELAVALARFQAARIPALSHLWGDLERADALDEVPGLPCDLFRLRRIAVHPEDEDARCFRSSGTTQGREARGEHCLRTTRTYAAAALAWAEQLLWPDRQDLSFIGVAAGEAEAPASSLAFMLTRFAEHLDEQASWHGPQGRVDVDSLARACWRSRAGGRPALVAGTSLALAAICDELDAASLALPPGSRVMHTGGFKSSSRDVAPVELRQQIATLFHLPPSHVVGEYGMTELSSQLYEGSLRRALGLGCEAAQPGCYYPPPWVRVRAVDPETLRPLPRGEAGLCEVLDLANVDSAVLILTADRVRLRGDGSCELLGRAAGAAPRGCSLEF